MSEWQRLGKPSEIRIVEVGPGRGTLCADILRRRRRGRPFRTPLTDVHLVEPSLTLRVEQRRTLQARPSNTSSSKPEETKSVEWVVEGHEGRDARVAWHSSLEDVPHGIPTLFIGQEVLDAFPPYQFVRTAEGWREKLVDLDDQEASVSCWRRSRRPRRGRSRRISSRTTARTRWKWRLGPLALCRAIS